MAAAVVGLLANARARGRGVHGGALQDEDEEQARPRPTEKGLHGRLQLCSLTACSFLASVDVIIRPSHVV